MTRTTIGIIIIERDSAPANTEKEPKAKTIRTYPTIPMTIDGSPVRTSLKNLTAYENLSSLANSERYMPVRSPTGVPIAAASPTTIKVPCIAGAIPPLPEPIEPCGCVRKS